MKYFLDFDLEDIPESPEEEAAAYPGNYLLLFLFFLLVPYILLCAFCLVGFWFVALFIGFDPILKSYKYFPKKKKEKLKNCGYFSLQLSV